MTYRIEWSALAVKRLDTLDRRVARAIVRFMAERTDGQPNPRQLGKPLRGEGLWRYRIGDYRVLCRIEDRVLVVLVVELGHRRDVYRWPDSAAIGLAHLPSADAGSGEWSRHSDSNRGPAVYETAALPLSYVGPGFTLSYS